MVRKFSRQTPRAGKRIVSAAWTAVGLVVLAGCDSADYSLAPVSGTVTLDDEPLAGAVVNFQPMNRSASLPAPGSVGRTDDQGRYELATIHDEPGAYVGRHKVKIYSYSPESPIVSDEDTGDNQERVPERYNYRTRLTLEVPAGGTDSADFDLTTAPE